VSQFSHLSLESEQRANHEDNVQLHTAHPTRALGTRPELTTATLMGSVQLNMAPPIRVMGTHPETTPSTLPGKKLKCV